MGNAHNYRYLFGPVPSRRLGRSLGIDLVPSKTCTENCVFCQVGPTPATTLERREYVPVADVLAEFRAWHAGGGTADAVTLSGAGEPTLHARFGDVLDGIGALCPVRRVLLSNGTLLHVPAVREGARRADVVKVSLSAWDEASFRVVNRPHGDLHFDVVLAGMVAFRAMFDGVLWLEVFALAGLNDNEEAMRRIAALAAPLRPDHVHLNTVVRRPAEPTARAVPVGTLESLRGLFEPVAEVVASVPGGDGQADAGATRNSWRRGG